MALKSEIPEHWRNSRRNRVALTTHYGPLFKFVEGLYEQYSSTRKKSLPKDQAEDFKANLICLLLDLLSCVEEGDGKWIGYSAGKPNFISGGVYWSYREDRPSISYTHYKKSIGFLEEQGLVVSETAPKGFSTFSSRVKATEKLADIFKETGADWTAINESPTAQCIIVKDENKRPTAWPDQKGFPLYEALENLERINTNLTGTFINLNVSDEAEVELRQRMRVTEENDFQTNKALDFSNRTIRRIFSEGSFQSGGRFYGGWWQGVPSEYRKHIEIDGSVTVELDYSTLQPRILYAWSNHEIPNDSYILPSWGKEFRPLVKKAFSQLLNSDESSRNPNQWHRFSPNIDPDPLPDDWRTIGKNERDKRRRDFFAKKYGRDYRDLIAELLEYHKPIEEFFFSGVWGKTQNIDSKIAERVMIHLLNEEIPITALPIHDSFIVPFGAEHQLNEAMNKAFIEMVGIEPKIDRDAVVFEEEENKERLIWADKEFHERVREKLQTHTQYNRRSDQWHRSYGPL